MTTAREVWRDYVVDGVQSSGVNKPSKQAIRDWGAQLEATAGTTPGTHWNFDSSTAMSLPAAGNLRLDNSTFSTVGNVAVSGLSSDSGNPSIRAFVNSWDDTGTTANRGFLMIQKVTAPQNFVVYRITGSVTDNSPNSPDVEWLTFSVTYVAGSGSFTNADALMVFFSPTGPDVTFGKQSIWVPAAAMLSQATNGPLSNTLEMAGAKNIYKVFEFDPTTQQFAQFHIRMPKSWDEGTVTFIPYWSHPATTVNFGVVWGLDAVARGDGLTLDVPFGTAQTSTDTGGTTDVLFYGPESAGITVSLVFESAYVMFRIHRDPANGSDTLAVVARLHGVLVLYTNNASNDT